MRGNRNAPAGNRGASRVRFIDEETNTSIVPGFPPVDPIYEARLAGWLEGYHCRDAEIARLNYLVDLWYFCANNRGKRPSDYNAAATDRLWQEAIV